MKKKVLAFALVCVMLFSMVPFSAFAAEAACPGKGHTHSKALCKEGTYTEVEVVPSLCGEWGYTLYQCDICGEFFAEDLNKVDGNHDWKETTPAVAPTCTVAGKTAIETCANCGNTRGGAPVEALNHKNKELVSSTGNCEVKGENTYLCPDCGETIVEVVPGTGEGHDWDEKTVEIKVEPTWDTKGVAVYHCSKCEATKEYDIAPLGHTCTDSLVKTEAKAPTCVAKGNIEYYTCNVCKKLYADAAATTEVEAKDTVVAKLTACAPATLVKTDAVAADCLNSGNIEYYTCSVCGKIYSDAAATTEIKAEDTVVKALGHDTVGVTPEDSVAATCTEDGWAKIKCARCGVVVDVVLPATGHTYKDKPTEYPATCTEFGVKVYACKVCGDVIKDKTEAIPPLGHTTYDDATSTDKVEVKANCTADGLRTWKCGRCGIAQSEVLEKTGHKTVSVTVAPTCAQYGYTYEYCTNADCTLAVVDKFTVSGVDYSVTVKGASVHLLPGYTVGDTYDSNNHNLTSSTINAATCTAAGNEVGYCSYCSAYVVRTIDPLGHDYSDLVVGSPKNIDQTCTTAEQREYKCTRCDATEVRTTADKGALGHDFSVLVVGSSKNVDQSCTTDEQREYKCSRCDATEVRKTPGKEATGHSYEGVVGVKVAPTCQADGYTGYECANGCGYVDKRDIVKYSYQDEYTLAEAKTAHPNMDAGVEFRTGTCKIVGLWRHFCPDCNVYIFVAVDGTGTGHTPPVGLAEKTDTSTEFLGKEPTCTEAGYTAQYTCTVCGELVVSVEKPALGHVWNKTPGKAATCTAAGNKATWTCDRKGCGVTDTENDGSVIPALGHDYEDVAEVPATCDKDGVSAYKVCKVCGEEDGTKTAIPAKNHVNSEAVATRVAANCLDFSCTLMRCKDCGYEYVTNYKKVGAHNYVTTTTDATCDKAGEIKHVCSLCGDTYTETIPATGHDYKLDSTVDPTCTVAGTKTYKCTKCGGSKVDVIPPTGHHNAAGETIVDDCCDTVTDRTCKDCGAEIGKKHNSLTTVTVPATCKEYGYTLDVCTACGYSKVTSVDESYLAGHTYGDWVVTTPPTVTSKGVETQTCKVCGDKQTRDVDPLPGILYSFEVVNANGMPGISDSSLIAVKVKLNSAKVDVWGLQLNVKYDDAKFDFVSAEFLTDKFITGRTANDNGGYVSILASAPNTAEGTTQNITIEGEEDLVVLYFRVTCAEKATATFSFGDVTAIRNDATAVKGAGTDATVQIQKFLDVNGDGDINIADALAAYKMVTGESKIAYDVRADVDKDGKITLADFVALYQYIAGARTYEEMTNSSAE